MNDADILLAHGSGGKLTQELLDRVFFRYFGNVLLNKKDDAAVWSLPSTHCLRMAITTDSYVVKPIFFPGGDIGKLAVCGTINDLAMTGAQPLYLTAGFIIEEGFLISDLEKIVASMAKTAQLAKIEIIAGDTKVVEKGDVDRLFINTAGIGTIDESIDISSINAKPGDAVILSGPVDMHGLAVLSQREGLRFSFPLASDCAPLNGLVARMVNHKNQIHCLRDPTRGGLATTLNELAIQSQVGIEIEEASIPVPEEVRAACEMLGLDPLYVANEGKLVAIVASEAEKAILERMHSHPYGREGAVIGRVTADHPGRVALKTRFGARRILSLLNGEQLPRIC